MEGKPQPSHYSSFWIRESAGKAVDVPQVAALNLLPPDTVPERILRKLSNEDTPRPASVRSSSVAIEHYVRFGEECASRNMVPSFRLFELWLEADRIGEV